jgi:hypothetical protein
MGIDEGGVKDHVTLTGGGLARVDVGLNLPSL